MEAAKKLYMQAQKMTLGMAALVKAFEARRIILFPLRKEYGHRFVECGKFCMAENGGFHLSNGKAQVAIVRSCRIGLGEKCGADARNHLPVTIKCVNVAQGNASEQVAIDKLHIFRLGAVDVAWEIEIEAVFRIGYFVNRHKTGVARNVVLTGKGVYNLVDILLAKTIFVAIFDKAFRSVYHEDAFAGGGILLVEYKNTGGNTCTIKKVGR